MKAEFISVVNMGRLSISASEAIRNALAAMEGKNVRVTITKHSQRSSRQNKYYWQCIGILSQEIGYTKEEMHEVVKCKFLKREKVHEGTGEVMEYLKSTSKLNREEFADLINQLQIWAADSLNVILPDPKEQLKIV